MKSLLTIVSLLAIAHLLALGGFVGWLVGTDRLDAERLEEIRALVETPRGAEEEEDSDEDASDDSGQGSETGRAEKTSGPALSAEEKLTIRLDERAIVNQRRTLAARAIEDMRAAYRRDVERLDERREKFEAEKEAFEQRIARLRETDGSEQFQKAVGLLERMDAAQAAQMMRALIEGDAPVALPDDKADSPGQTPRERGLTRVVSYLNAMKDRKRGEVMSEFADQEPALAAELLERLRTRGLHAHAPEDAEDAP